MADDALVLACAGCCCGHPRHGGALAPQRVLKAEARRAYRAAGLEGRARLSFAECLGPCSESNVAFVYLHGQPLWLRRMNAPEHWTELFRYLREAIDAPGTMVPAALAARAFSWTGGGIGPKPPVEAAP